LATLIGAAAAATIATTLAWRVRAVGGLLAAGSSASAAAAAAIGWTSRPTAIAVAFALAVVSLASTAIGAVLTRLLADEDGERAYRGDATNRRVGGL
jgi:hypothetical protein